LLLCFCHHNTFELAVATEAFIRKCSLDCGCAHTILKIIMLFPMCLC
jgi:hypothetical protein